MLSFQAFLIGYGLYAVSSIFILMVLITCYDKFSKLSVFSANEFLHRAYMVLVGLLSVSSGVLIFLHSIDYPKETFFAGFFLGPVFFFMGLYILFKSMILDIHKVKIFLNKHCVFRNHKY